MNDKDTTAAAIAVSIWFVAYHAGMFIAAGVDRAFGFLLMAASTAILAVIMAMDNRLDKKQERIDRLVRHDVDQLEEAIRKCE